MNPVMDFLAHAPSLPTRRALLVLDCQRDLLSPIDDTFLHRIPPLAAFFRHADRVFWVQSLFRQPREAYSDAAGGDRILVTADADPDAFLHADHRCCLPDSPGAAFAPAIHAAIDPQDTVLRKDDYSALQAPGLLFALRAQLITQLFLCGARSNVSVYATVLDAVSQGFEVTLIEDALGYRCAKSHRLALQRMTEGWGVDTTTSHQLLGESGETAAPPPQREILKSEPVEPEAPVETKPPPQREPPKSDPIEVDDEPDDQGDVDLQPPLLARTRRRRDPPPDRKPQSSRKMPSAASSTLGPEDPIGAGDSRILYDLLPRPDDAFHRLREEVHWQKMYHMAGQVPRLVAVQGRIGADGAIPIYRHPADESPPLRPFTPTVETIAKVVEQHLGHPLNHVLIQLYRHGEDRISEHADKTLDIVRGSAICNVSLGARRTMTLRTKGKEKDAQRQIQRVPMPHNSLFVLGETTNRQWLHGIRPDKRPDALKSPDERAFAGARISLTFRHIGTYIDPAADTIWGQGARSKTPTAAGRIVHGEPAETERLIRAFGQENQQSAFDWDAYYGEGFDVVNFVTTANAKIVLAGEAEEDEVADLRVLLTLVENGVRYEVVSSIPEDLPPEAREGPGNDRRPAYLDQDGSTYIAGDAAILQYISTHRRAADTPEPDPTTTEGRLAAADALLTVWRTIQATQSTDLDALIPHLTALASFLPPGHAYLSAPIAFGLDDCLFWPVLRNLMRDGTGKGRELVETQFPALAGYYAKVGKRACVRQVLEEMNLSIEKHA